MVVLTLSGGGFTLQAGDRRPNLASNGPLHSPGRITERPSPDGLGLVAHSFFDIFFEISTPLGTLHNNNPLDSIAGQQACRMAADITQVPPTVGTEYRGCFDPDTSTDLEPGPLRPFVDLYDDEGNHVAILTEAVSHFVGVPCGGAGEPRCPFNAPEPSTLVLVGAGLAGLTGIAWRRHRRR